MRRKNTNINLNMQMFFADLVIFCVKVKILGMEMGEWDVFWGEACR
jgi:hypothetical protein